MSYPLLAQSNNSEEVRLSGRQLTRATNGKPYIHTFYTGDYRVFPLHHPGVTNAAKVAHEAFYAANKSTTFTFVWNADGATYTVQFSEKAPAYKPLPGGRWDINVELITS